MRKVNPTKGNALSRLVRHLCSFIGSTEGGPCHLVSPPDSSHWNEFNFIDVGHKMEEVEDGIFELVYPNTDLTQRSQLHFHSYPELSEYRTKDLFIPVPGKEGWWTYRGRTDNWIIMSNALKVDPTDIENTVGSHPDVRGVLVAGDRRHRLCLLVELKDEVKPGNDIDREQILTKLWPYIEEANRKSSKFGRIPRELVYFATREKPFLRASKGTIQRRLTIEAYADEINELYAKAEHGLLTHALPPLEKLDRESLAKLLQYLYADVLKLDDGIGIDKDVLAAGIDSFGIMTISSRLKAALRQYGISEVKLDVVSVKTLYSASTIGSLAEALVTALSTSDGDISDEQDPGDGNIRNDILAFVQKYKTKVQHLVENGPVISDNNEKNGEKSTSGAPCQTVLLTGSTGSLGSYLLDALLTRSDIKKVICLNRGSDAKQRQVKSLESRRLPPLPQNQEDKGRVVFLQADLQDERLGLSREDYAFVAREATVIVHNAYPVNFLMSISQFEPHLRGLLNLMELALRGSTSLMFVSSISTGMSATGRRQRVPEIVLDTATQVDDLLPQGYAQSKYVCEQMLETFAGGLTAQSVAVLRVGQICGPRLGSGPWNKWEWFPSLVMSSHFLGVAPDDIGQTINWIPVDELAKIVSDLIDYTQPSAVTNGTPETVKTTGIGAEILGDPMQSARASPRGRQSSQPSTGQGQTASHLQVYNVVNPSVSLWKSVLPALQTAIPDIIPVSQWIMRLEESVETSTYLLDKNPGAKLVAFYKGALLGGDRAEPVYDVDNLIRASSTAASLEPVTQSDLERWMDAWV